MIIIILIPNFSDIVDGEIPPKMATAPSRSGSLSSVSYQRDARSVSGKSRANMRPISRNTNDFHDDHDVDGMTSFSKDDSCVLCAPPNSVRLSPRSMSAPRETRTIGYSTENVTTRIKDSDRVTSPSRDVVTQSRSLHTSHGTSKRGSQSPGLQTRDSALRAESRDDVSRAMSRGSSRMSSHPNSSPSQSPWQQDEMEVSRDEGQSIRTGSRMSKYGENTFVDFGSQGIVLRSRSASTREQKLPSREGSGYSRPISAPISIPGDGTNGTLATLGSEANIADVVEVTPRHHAFMDDSDDARSLESPDVAWPVNADGELVMSGDELSEYGSEAEGQSTY